MHIILRAFALTLIVFLSVPALAADLMVKDAWARASAGPAKAGGAFMIIHNPGVAADTLIAASAPVTEKAELHTHIIERGIMRMREVEGGIDVPADSHVELKPGGLHVMFFGLYKPLKEGETFPLTLRFKNAGIVTTTVTVKGAGAMGSAMMNHDHMDHEKMDHGKMDHDKMDHDKMAH